VQLRPTGFEGRVLFSLFATLALSKINIRKWLTWFLQSCAEHGGQVPADIDPCLPWKMSDEKLREMALDPSDTS
jgi:transposase